MNRFILTIALISLVCKPLLAQRGIVIAPDSGEPSTQLSVSITGLNTSFGSGTYTLDFFKQGSRTNQIEANGFQVSSPNTLETTLFIKGSATAGVYTYKLNNTFSGVVNGLNPFYISPQTASPSIVSVSPNLGHLNQNLTVSITGSRTQFTQGSSTAVFFRNGSPTTSISVNGYTAENDSLLKLDVFIPNQTNRGIYDLAIFNGAGILIKNKSFEVTWALSVDKHSVKNTPITLYPNPAKEKLSLESGDALIEKVSVIDMQGRLVQTETPEQPTKKLELNIGEYLLPNQYLIIKIHTSKGVFFERILIQ
ncbi:MAG: T9SS type A sorting domain-containing protein [Bacteroidota bacterium]|nr:T9SS type A sorting domain-containing protein [Bacteroidota bacterium]